MSKSMLQRFMPNSPLQVLCGNLVIGFIFTLQSVTDAQLNPQGAYQNPRSPNWNSQTPFTPPQNLLENRQGQRLMHHNSSPTQGQQGRSPRIQPSNFGKFDNSSGYAPASSTRYLNRQNTSTRTATANDNNSLTRQFRSYQINQANSSNVTKQLQQQLGDMVEIVNDPTHNRIVVNATDSNHRMVKQFIDRMESPQTRPAALSKSKSIRSFNVSVEMLRNAANQLSQLYVDQNRIIVAADETAGKLLVFSTEPDYQEVTTYLRRNGYLDTRKPFDPGKPGVQYHQLKNVGWRELETAIFRGWGNTLKIEVSQDGNFSRIQIPTLDQRQSNIQIDRRNNQVQIESSGLQLTGITNLIHLLDQPAGTGKLEIIKTNPEAIDQVQSTVSMFKFAALQQDVQPKTTSAIIGKAKRNGVYAIYQDQATPEDADPNQDPTTQENTEETLGPIGRVEIITIPGTDIIILKGDPKDVERVRTLIQQIEKTSEEYKPVIEVLPLNHVDNIAVQVIADEVYTNFYEPSLGETSITALVKPNALLLVGTPQGVTQAREIVEKLDVEVEAKTEFKVFRIKHMSAVDLENRLRSFYLGQSTTGFGANGGGNQNNAAQGFGGEGLATRMRLASDYRSNTLFVHASRRDMDEITKFIAEIDVESTGEGNEDHLKIIRLKNSTASELAPILQDILTGQLQGAGQSTTGNNNNQNNQFNNQNNQQFSQVRSAMLALRSLDPSGKIVRSSILFDTRVTSDENSNSLIIKAPPGSMELIELLVNQLDQLPDVESQIKVFELENASSPQVVETIQNLFEAQQGGGGNNAGGTNIIPLETGGFDSTIVSLRLAADARSNTVIAAGSQGDLNIIEALVTRLDEDIESKYIHKIFRLQNVTADVVEEALTGWLTGRSDTLSADPRIIGSGDGSLESVKRAITIQAETETNSLIVSAHKEYIHIIETMIRDIDFKKQVVIQAVIAEVQLSDTFEFGIEWGVQDSLVFDRGLGDGIGYPFNSSALGNTITAGTPGLLSREDLAGQVLQNLNVGRSNTGLGYGGLVMSAGNESINVLLRALDDKSKVDILSRPQITTMENIQAFVQVGQDLPYVTGVDNSNTAGGNTTFATDFLELGVTLSVTPRVRPDGEIWMRVDVSNSSVADGDGVAIQTTASGGVVFQPIINDQTLQTDVSAHSGQTIVLGGLIQSVTQDVVRGIPFFSDIPGIGRLFRFESEQNTRTELFVILRPVVIDSPEDRDRLMQIESQRMNWCVEDVIDIHGPILEKETLAGETDTVYPDRTPTGYHREAKLQQAPSRESFEMGSLAPLNNGNPRDQNLLGQMPQPTERHFATETRQRPNPQMHQQQPAYPHNPQVFQLGSPPNPQSSGATPKTSQASQKNGLFPFSFK